MPVCFSTVWRRRGREEWENARLFFNVDLIEDDRGHANSEKIGLFLNFKITVILIERIDEAMTEMARPHLEKLKQQYYNIGLDGETSRQEKEGRPKTPGDVTLRQSSSKRG